LSRRPAPRHRPTCPKFRQLDSRPRIPDLTAVLPYSPVGLVFSRRFARDTPICVTQVASGSIGGCSLRANGFSIDGLRRPGFAPEPGPPLAPWELLPYGSAP